MPILISGGDSQEASRRELSVFALCALTDKREASKRQLLLMICIGFMLYSLYNESVVLCQVQRELLQLLRETPKEDIDEFFNQAVSDLLND